MHWENSYDITWLAIIIYFITLNAYANVFSTFFPF